MPKLNSPRAWNLIAVIVLGVMAIEQIVGFRGSNPTAIVLWISGAVTIGTVVWGLWNYKKSCSWLIPRIYAIASVPNVLLLFDAQSWTKFWVALVGAVIFTLILSGVLDSIEKSRKTAETK